MRVIILRLLLGVLCALPLQTYAWGLPSANDIADALLRRTGALIVGAAKTVWEHAKPISSSTFNSFTEGVFGKMNSFFTKFRARRAAETKKFEEEIDDELTKAKNKSDDLSQQAKDLNTKATDIKNGVAKLEPLRSSTETLACVAEHLKERAQEHKEKLDDCGASLQNLQDHISTLKKEVSHPALQEQLTLLQAEMAGIKKLMLQSNSELRDTERNVRAVQMQLHHDDNKAALTQQLNEQDEQISKISSSLTAIMPKIANVMKRGDSAHGGAVSHDKDELLIELADPLYREYNIIAGTSKLPSKNYTSPLTTSDLIGRAATLNRLIGVLKEDTSSDVRLKENLKEGAERLAWVNQVLRSRLQEGIPSMLGNAPIYFPGDITVNNNAVVMSDVTVDMKDALREAVGAPLSKQEIISPLRAALPGYHVLGNKWLLLENGRLS